MTGILVFLYIVIMMLTALLAFAQFVHVGEKKYKYGGVDGVDCVFYAFGSLALGGFWFITVWFVLVLWYVSDETPYWVKIVKNITKFIDGKINK